MIVEGGDRDQDVFITKLDDNGTFVWSRQIGGTRLESAATLAIDKQAYLYISGFFSDTTNFSPGVSDFKLIANNNESVAEELRMYTCKFDSEGNFIWAVKMNNDTGQFFASVQLDNSGNVVATVADDTIREAVALPQWNDMESISKPFYSLSDDKATVFPETSAEFRIGEQPELSVFPNPTKGEIHIGLEKSYDHISVKDANIGSKVTMKYPSCYLMEPGARGEMLSMAFAGTGQTQDAGSKMYHFAPNTSSKITSKSISKGGGRASYRGMV